MFINSDPLIITLYLCFLRSAGVTDHQIVFRLCIHDSADVEQAQAFWVQVTGADPARFRRPTLKHHNPKTIRLNTNEGYHGCLRIDVLGSAALYLRIEGWCDAIMNGAVAAVGGSS